MKTQDDCTGLRNRAVVFWIFFLLSLMAICLCCTKPEPLHDFTCSGAVIRSAPGFISDTQTYVINKLDVSEDFILGFQDNRNYTMQQCQNGVLVTTVSTLVCKNVDCVEIK